MYFLIYMSWLYNKLHKILKLQLAKNKINPSKISIEYTIDNYFLY